MSVTERAMRLAAAIVERPTSSSSEASPEPARARRSSRAERAAVGASALSAAPIRYTTRPVTAEALLRTTCASCPPGSRCCAGYTALCCTLPGGSNFGCPDHTFVGGWWQCSYGGTGLCGTTNVRYYLDCSIDPGHACPGGCHCGSNNCSNFKTCCVVFRYGQCNTQIDAVTPIMCRLVTCVLPCTIDCLNCHCSAAYDQVTCSHNAGCL
jgi:hypothetical protein